jgi:hypothetical protein
MDHNNTRGWVSENRNERELHLHNANTKSIQKEGPRARKETKAPDTDLLGLNWRTFVYSKLSIKINIAVEIGRMHEFEQHDAFPTKTNQHKPLINYHDIINIADHNYMWLYM